MHSEDLKKSIQTFVFLATPVALKTSTSILKFLVPFESILNVSIENQANFVKKKCFLDAG